MKTIVILCSTTFIVVFNLNCTVVFGGDDLQNWRIQNETGVDLISYNSLSTLWLKDLLNSYQISFPLQFGSSLKLKNTSNPSNINKWRDEAGICQNVTFFSVEQNKRIISKHGRDRTLNHTIRSLMFNPRVRLFRFDNFQGAFEDLYYLKSAGRGMCTRINELGKRVDSVFTFGKCVRLFQFGDCGGNSLAVYPGSLHSNKLSELKPVTFQSIGKCFRNEFSGSSFHETRPRFVIKNPHLRGFVPDLVPALTPDFWLLRKGAKAYNEIVYQFEVGPNNRTQMIFINLRKTALQNIIGRTGITPLASVTIDHWNFEKTLEKEDGDVVGFAFPPKFGGPTTEAFNAFPASKQSVVEWERELSRLLEGRREAWIYLTFEYENTNKSRPTCFYFYAGLDRKPFYGRILNGHSNAKRDISFPTKSEGHKKSLRSFGVNPTTIYQLYSNISQITRSINSKQGLTRNFNLRNLVSVKFLLSCRRRRSSEGEVQGNYNESHLLNSTIQEMIAGPMVRIFSGENLTGDFEDYHSGKSNGYSYQGCFNSKTNNKVKSATTFNKCIRLFDEKDCFGISLAIYLGSEYSDRIAASGLTQVRSVGPCLLEEFENATFSLEKTGQVVKDKKLKLNFPDLLLHQFSDELLDGLRYFYRDKFGHIKMFSPDFDILKGDGLTAIYGLGTNDRVEQIDARIYFFGLVEVKGRTRLQKKNDFLKSWGKKDGDIPCYLIPLLIGGPSNESWNIFPTSQSKCEDWTRIFPTSFSDANEFFNFRVTLNFVYDSDFSTKPPFLYYHVYVHSQFRIYYGRFVF